MSYFKAKMHQIRIQLGLRPRPHWGVSNKCIAVRKVATPLRELKCHMGSHSVTCHPTEVTFPLHFLPLPFLRYPLLIANSNH